METPSRLSLAERVQAACTLASNYEFAVLTDLNNGRRAEIAADIMGAVVLLEAEAMKYEPAPWKPRPSGTAHPSTEA